MNDDLGATLGRLAALPADPDFGFGRRLMELRDEMVESLGSRRTRELWKELSPVKKGRIAGERTYADVATLVRLFDTARADEMFKRHSPTRLRNLIAQATFTKGRSDYGATIDGVAKRLQRALQEREREVEKAKRRAGTQHRNLLADLLLLDTKSRELVSETPKDGLKSPLQSNS